MGGGGGGGSPMRCIMENCHNPSTGWMKHVFFKRLYNYTGNCNKVLVENGLNESVPTADTEMQP